MRRARELAVFVLVLSAGSALAQQSPVPVDAINASTRTACAEKDNVYVKLQSKQVRTLRIEASHPAYLKDMKADTVAPDFKSCDMSRDPAHRFMPREVVLHDAGNWTLRGFTYPQFWRPSQVPVNVGGKVETGLHLLQLWTRGKARDEEVLVLYPADGYWRARPLAPAQLGWTIDPKLPTAYGSSFLIGPIEEKGRPFVDIKSVTFEPDLGAFGLVFGNGTRAVLRIWSLTDARNAIEVAFSDVIDRRPFAALRSMYVADDNNDAAQVAWQDMPGKKGAAGVMAFRQAKGIGAFWAGRTVPSRHNTSAPDMTFGTFRGFKSEGL
jgi:hypothetical protein